MFWFFGHKARAILATQSGTEPALPVLEDEILTTGSPGSPSYMIMYLSSTVSGTWFFLPVDEEVLTVGSMGLVDLQIAWDC